MYVCLWSVWYVLSMIASAEDCGECQFDGPLPTLAEFLKFDGVKAGPLSVSVWRGVYNSEREDHVINYFFLNSHKFILNPK